MSDKISILTTRLALLLADLLTLPPDHDRIRQIFNTASELKREIYENEDDE